MVLEQALTSLKQKGLNIEEKMSMYLKLPEAGASTEIQRQRPLSYPELATHDIAYKLKSWIYTCAKSAAARGDIDPKILTVDGRDCKYQEGGETHKAAKDLLKST
ncbi:hypothetical protein R1sor_003959 [Riccia sorocarpa]|uniref:Uncharacterized protein n=1 Tax=Riccia sorocarpa TaxID=122646 RepID=A0ABD3H355_9MARC